MIWLIDIQLAPGNISERALLEHNPLFEIPDLPTIITPLWADSEVARVHKALLQLLAPLQLNKEV